MYGDARIDEHQQDEVDGRRHIGYRAQVYYRVITSPGGEPRSTVESGFVSNYGERHSRAGDSGKFIRATCP